MGGRVSIRDVYNNNNFWASHTYCRYYHPKRGGNNPSHGLADQELLWFKSGSEWYIKKAAGEYLDVLREFDIEGMATLVVVPGHGERTTNANSPVARVAVILAGMHPDRYQARIDALIRHTTIQKLSLGGSRSIELHLQSIQLSSEDGIRDRTVIILDDVATSGSSISACRQILTQSNPQKIGAIVLGQTI